MSGSIKRKIGVSSAFILLLFVVISAVVCYSCVRLTGSRYQDSIADSVLDMAEFTINADIAKESFSTRSVSDEYTSVQNKLLEYQKRNSKVVKRISLVSFSNTSGGYIYDTDGHKLGMQLEYDEYTSSVKAELLNGRNTLRHFGNGTLTVYRPLRTVNDSLCGYIIVELTAPYEYDYLSFILLVFGCMLAVCLIFIILLGISLNRKIFRPLREIVDSAVAISQSKDDNIKVSPAFFNSKRSDEIGMLSKALQDIFFSIQSSTETLDRIRFDANHDGMTHMLNKRSYNTMLEKFKNCDMICLIYFDVNNLKLMNDTLGHESGDYVIKAAAEYIQGFLTENDYCFRMGGDEFLVVMTECTYRSVDKIIDKLENDCPYILSRETDSIKCALSFGYACEKADYSYEELLAEAEENMYRKKAALKKQLQMPDR